MVHVVVTAACPKRDDAGGVKYAVWERARWRARWGELAFGALRTATRRRRKCVQLEAAGALPRVVAPE